MRLLGFVEPASVWEAPPIGATVKLRNAALRRFLEARARPRFDGIG